MTVKPTFIHRWPRDSGIISFSHYMDCGMQNLVSINWHDSFRHLQLLHCSDLVFTTSGIVLNFNTWNRAKEIFVSLSSSFILKLRGWMSSLANHLKSDTGCLSTVLSMMASLCLPIHDSLKGSTRLYCVSAGYFQVFLKRFFLGNEKSQILCNSSLNTCALGSRK